MITIEAETPKVGSFTISGSCAKQSNETVLRNDVVENYINKQRQITNTARLMEEYMTRE